MTSADKVLIYCFVSFSDLFLWSFSIFLLPTDIFLHMVNITSLLINFIFYIVYDKNLILLFYVLCAFLRNLIHYFYMLFLGWKVVFIIMSCHTLFTIVLFKMTMTFFVPFFIFTEMMIRNLYIVSYFLIAKGSFHAIN